MHNNVLDQVEQLRLVSGSKFFDESRIGFLLARVPKDLPT